MMIKAQFIKSLLLIVVVVSFVSGCAATGPSYTSIKTTIPQLTSDQARLYFLREGSFMGAGITARVRLNGTHVADLNTDGFAYADSPPGNVLIMIDASLNPGEAKQTIKIESGKTYYFLVAPNSDRVMGGVLFGFIGAAAVGGGPFTFSRISEATALEQLKTKNLSGN
jgi:hypothetical protein